MVYNIMGFDQRALYEIQGNDVKLNATDLLVLKYISDFCNRGSVTKVFKNKTFNWVSYNLVISDLKYFDLSKKMLQKIYIKLESYGLIERYVDREKCRGTFVYIRIGDAYEKIVYGAKGKKYHSESPYPMDENVLSVDEKGNSFGGYPMDGENVEGVEQKGASKYIYNNNNINNNNNIINNNTIIDKPKKEKPHKFDQRESLAYVEEEFREVWETWLDYKEEKKQPYTTLVGAKKRYEMLMNLSERNPLLAQGIVMSAIEHGWDGFYLLTEKQREFFLSEKSPYLVRPIQNEKTEDSKPSNANPDGSFYRDGILYR